MNLTFKAALLKGWTLLDDKIIYGDEAILLADIKDVKLVIKPSFATNGVIQFYANNRCFTIAFPNKSRADGEKALAYLQRKCNTKCCTKKEVNIRKTMAQIQNEINALPCKDDWGTRKEIKELPLLLNVNEEIKSITSGFCNGNTWLLVCTNRRVLMLDKGILYGLKMIDIPLDRVNSISHTKGLLLGKIAITDGSVTRTIENVSNNTVSFFADTVNKQVQIYKNSKNQPTTQVVNNISVADELLKFKQLLDMGVLTKEEFDMQKKELLGL